MPSERLATVLGQCSREVGVRLDETQVELFQRYLVELLEWNEKFNLTAVTDPDDIIIKHFVDSLSPLPYLQRPANLLDIGSGPGFPGIPLKIAAPDLQVHLTDASRKKVSFLKHLIRTLGLSGITASHGRIEDLPPPVPRFHILISRAFRSLQALLEVVHPLLAPGVMLVAMRGPTTEHERVQLQRMGSAKDLELIRAVTLELPRSRGDRTLLFFQKT